LRKHCFCVFDENKRIKKLGPLPQTLAEKKLVLKIENVVFYFLA